MQCTIVFTRCEDAENSKATLLGDTEMTRKNSTFTDFDPFKVWTDFDPMKAADQFTKMFGDMGANLPKGMPQVDMDALMASQRKSLEVMNVVNQKALEGVRAVSERQAEIVRDAVEKTSSAMDVLGKTKSPQEAVEKQAEMARKAYDKSVKDLTDLRDLVVKTNKEVVDPINTRIQESFDEIKAMTAASGK